ncbi:amidase domain-containing protein [Robertmurraya andreesenii]|uniref:Putative amidase domain-containing protein n=1 Tax=Anoxybacillus andreesenii TaxID=1325932 RepID=A0ABT9V9B3_9BACL|nr:amidase domain-containing protein [Robertmurraya andreesenii]MDQ0157541.1 hypothetical protein [Robertmurraya andreesenii]
MKEQLQEHLLKRVNQCVSNPRNKVCEKIEAKKESLAKRNAEIVKVKAIGNIIKELDEKEPRKVFYRAHFQYLINHKEKLYIEEEVEERVAEFYKDILVEDKEMNLDVLGSPEEVTRASIEEEITNDERVTFFYDRLQAVKYAERWWNDYNPAFRKFDVDCTNYISQCLHAGDAPMVGYPNRSNGWWMRSNNWSYSWTVANSLRWYLPGAKIGIRAREVSDPQELKLGDVICYDFQGDGRFDHTTIVTAKDVDDMPLVNAHTANSRMRYWAYEDSTAYTPNIKYKFLHILDDQS